MPRVKVEGESVTKPTGRPVGRPKVAPTFKRSHAILVRVSPFEYEELRVAAESVGERVSQFVLSPWREGVITPAEMALRQREARRLVNEALRRMGEQKKAELKAALQAGMAERRRLLDAGVASPDVMSSTRLWNLSPKQEAMVIEVGRRLHNRNVQRDIRLAGKPLSAPAARRLWRRAEKGIQQFQTKYGGDLRGGLAVGRIVLPERGYRAETIAKRPTLAAALANPAFVKFADKAARAFKKRERTLQAEGKGKGAERAG